MLTYTDLIISPADDAFLCTACSLISLFNWHQCSNLYHPTLPRFLVQKLRSMVHEIVGRINGHYGTLTHVPIHHLDRQLSFHELCALYAITDVALVTSLRDGMNLVSYEYVACQSDNAGKNLPAFVIGPQGKTHNA